MESCNVDNVLCRLGLDQFKEVFRSNDIDYEAFKCLTNEDMDRLNLSVGAIAKIRREIRRIQNIRDSGTSKKLTRKINKLNKN